MGIEALDIGLQRAGVAAIQAHEPCLDAEALERQVGEAVPSSSTASVSRTIWKL